MVRFVIRRGPGAMVVLVLGFAAPAGAATIPVTTTADTVDAADGACALREAVLAVNAPPGTGDCVRADANANTIALGPGTHALTRVGVGENAAATGDVDILAGTVSLTISGAGAGTTTINAAALGDRLFDVASGAPAVTFQQLTLTGGRAPSGQPGQAGTSQAGGAGEHAGAILSLAGLTLTDVVVTDNRAGAGGPGGSGGTSGGIAQPGRAGGSGGSAGALQVTGALMLTRVTFSFNQAGVAGSAPAAPSGPTAGPRVGTAASAGSAAPSSHSADRPRFRRAASRATAAATVARVALGASARSRTREVVAGPAGWAGPVGRCARPAT